jgi:hypothetical protein
MRPRPRRPSQTCGRTRRSRSSRAESPKVVYRLTQGLPVNQVLGEIPAAGATVYRGTRVRLTATRTLRWVKVFAGSGSDGYESDPFNVPERWRIRYRLSAASFFFPALAEFSWARGDHPFRDGGFVANAAGLGMYEVRDGAGTYRLGVNPYAGTSWYVEVDAFE